MIVEIVEIVETAETGGRVGIGGRGRVHDHEDDVTKSRQLYLSALFDMGFAFNRSLAFRIDTVRL
jgi:hypothetical protein